MSTADISGADSDEVRPDSVLSKRNRARRARPALRPMRRLHLPRSSRRTLVADLRAVRRSRRRRPRFHRTQCRFPRRARRRSWWPPGSTTSPPTRPKPPSCRSHVLLDADLGVSVTDRDDVLHPVEPARRGGAFRRLPARCPRPAQHRRTARHGRCPPRPGGRPPAGRLARPYRPRPCRTSRLRRRQPRRKLRKRGSAPMP